MEIPVGPARLDVEVVQPQQRDGVLDLETQKEGLHKVGGLLQGAHVLRVRLRLDLHLARLQIHPHVQLHVLRHRLEQLQPVVFQRRKPA